MLEHPSEAPRPAVTPRRAVVTLLVHAVVIWAACAATIGIGRAVTSMDRTLVIHAVAAPVFAAVVSALYFRRYGYTSPLVTAAAFLALIMLVDFFLVALVIERSLDMFRSALGTWLPFSLIFGATAVTGWWVQAIRRRSAARAS
jgi:hypothetical protein